MQMKSVHKVMIAAFLGVLPSICFADKLIIKKQPYDDCRVTGIEGDSIVFEFGGAAKALRRPLADVSSIFIDNEPAFKSAEEAFAKEQWDKATDEYTKAERGTSQQWIKVWCRRRGVEAAQKAGRFDVVVKNYIAVAQNNPDTAKSIILNFPNAESAYLPEAIKAAKLARDGASANPKAQEVLGRLLVDLYNAKNDTKGAQEATETLAAISARANPDSPETHKLLLQVKLAKINTDLEARKFDEVIKAIDSVAADVDDPADQIRMLWAMAEARKGKLGAAGGKDDWKEVAIAYMRVVANGKATDPKVIDSLLKVAEIHATKLDDKPAAQAMLKRMIEEEYKNMEAAKDAQKLLDKLK